MLFFHHFRQWKVQAKEMKEVHAKPKEPDADDDDQRSKSNVHLAKIDFGFLADGARSSGSQTPGARSGKKTGDEPEEAVELQEADISERVSSSSKRRRTDSQKTPDKAVSTKSPSLLEAFRPEQTPTAVGSPLKQRRSMTVSSPQKSNEVQVEIPERENVVDREVAEPESSSSESTTDGSEPEAREQPMDTDVSSRRSLSPRKTSGVDVVPNDTVSPDSAPMELADAAEAQRTPSQRRSGSKKSTPRSTPKNASAEVTVAAVEPGYDAVSHSSARKTNASSPVHGQGIGSSKSTPRKPADETGAAESSAVTPPRPKSKSKSGTPGSSRKKLPESSDDTSVEPESVAASVVEKAKPPSPKRRRTRSITKGEELTQSTTKPQRTREASSGSEDQRLSDSLMSDSAPPLATDSAEDSPVIMSMRKRPPSHAVRSFPSPILEEPIAAETIGISKETVPHPDDPEMAPASGTPVVRLEKLTGGAIESYKASESETESQSSIQTPRYRRVRRLEVPLVSDETVMSQGRMTRSKAKRNKD